MINTTDHLRRMAIFATVVDAGSFAEAARRLDLTRAAVSKQIGLLEEALGATLLKRTTRTIKLTQVGSEFHPRCRAILEQAADAWALASAGSIQPEGRLTISAPLALGEAFVGPRLPGFTRRYPRIGVNLQLTDEVSNLVAGGVDVAIRGGQPDDPSLTARRLADLDLVVCANPEHPPISVPRDLADVEWVAYAPLGVPNRLTFWHGDTQHKVRPTGRVVTNNAAVIRAFLLAGQGVALLPRFYVQTDLDAGRLVTVLSQYQLPRTGIFAIHPTARHVPLPVRVLIDYLVESVP